MYKYLIITPIPVFYKINLYKELSKRLNIFVIFISYDTNENRAKDFVSLENIYFKYKILNKGPFQKRKKLKSIFKLKEILNEIKFERLIVSGWDMWEFWYLIFSNPESKNCLSLESTSIESSTNGIKKVIKRIFLSKISIVFASGNLHVELLKKLGYKKQIRVTRGVGLINKPLVGRRQKTYKKNFLFIGRLSRVKNLPILIRVFNDLNEFNLTIIGEGEDEDLLKDMANENIIFKGAIQNKYLREHYLTKDLLILPSISETWGLVVEEALFFGMPVIVSKKCGSSELIKNDVNGYLIDPGDIQNIKSNIKKINQQKYLSLLDGVMEFSIDKKDFYQVEAYLFDDQ
jgi:glycosyltransferase involved in cell wall biosynthesis